MSAATQRDRLDIMKDIQETAKEMASNRDNADRLIELINKRQDLIAEYDKMNESQPPLADPQAAEVKRIAQDILKLDKVVSTALQDHMRNVKDDLADSTNQQKVLGYVNQAISTTGSYMDYKK